MRRSGARVAMSAVVGALVALIVGFGGQWKYAAVGGWLAAATVFLASLWLVIKKMDAAQTQAHATREDPTRAASDLVVVASSLASLAGVGLLLVKSSTNAVAAASFSLASIGASWLVLHSLFMVRYARLYYDEPVGGIDFNQDEPPTYADFAYLAFTLGMTYQVSDTNLQKPMIRATVLRHSLLSYLLGAIVLAATINLIAGLGTPSR